MCDMGQSMSPTMENMNTRKISYSKQCGFKMYALETLPNAQAYGAIYSDWCVLYQDFYSNKGTVCKVRRC